MKPKLTPGTTCLLTKSIICALVSSKFAIVASPLKIKKERAIKTRPNYKAYTFTLRHFRQIVNCKDLHKSRF